MRAERYEEQTETFFEGLDGVVAGAENAWLEFDSLCRSFGDRAPGSAEGAGAEAEYELARAYEVDFWAVDASRRDLALEMAAVTA